jgi:hypothetical protein
VKLDEFVCSKPDCTFAITGTCLESTDDPTHNCPHLKTAEKSSPSAVEEDSGAGFEDAAESVREFSSSLELGLQDVARLMRSRYAKLVGFSDRWMQERLAFSRPCISSSPEGTCALSIALS